MVSDRRQVEVWRTEKISVSQRYHPIDRPFLVTARLKLQNSFFEVGGGRLRPAATQNLDAARLPDAGRRRAQKKIVILSAGKKYIYLIS